VGYAWPTEKFANARPIQFVIDATAVRRPDFPKETGFGGRIRRRHAVSVQLMGDVRTATECARKFPGGEGLGSLLRLRGLAFRVRRLIHSA
jgi:hypothetical protein